MNKLFIIDDTLGNKISYYHVLLFLVFLPFDRFYSQLVLISFTIHTIIHLKKHFGQSILSKPVIILTAIYILNLIGLSYSVDLTQGLKDIEKQLAILLFPVIFSVNDLELKKYRKNLLEIFAITCTVTILYLYFDAFRIIRYNRLSFSSLFTNAFINQNFSSSIDLHATYLSMYVALSLTFFLNLILNETVFWKRILFSVAALICFAGLLQLSSRAVFFSVILIVTLILPFFLLKGVKRLKLIIITSLIIILAIFSITRIGVFKERMVTSLRSDLDPNVVHTELYEPRVVRWKCAWELIRASPVWGYGSGSEIKLLKEKYFEKKLFGSFLNELNAHNQYLSFLIKYGLIGLMLYLFTLCYGFIHAWRNKDPVFFSFMVLVAIVSLSENILDVNKGVFFYSFFFSFFIFENKNKRIPGYFRQE
jgi:O-antigen ligase